MELKTFLVKAKIATYASAGEANERVLEDGAKELSFESDGQRYRDRYYGFNPFVGEEIVWRDGEIVWSMNYFGRIISDALPAKDIYAFLQRAMKLLKEDRPFRGPAHFSDGDLEYIDESTGDIHDFAGKEKIFYKGQEVYQLKYHGGTHV